MELHMDMNDMSQELNLESLESRLEMESAMAFGDPVETTPICICHFW
jgi:hypothetical protein